MRKRYPNIISIILPNKKINIIVIGTILLGVTFGAIFANIISINDQNQVIEKIKLFIDNINNNNLNALSIFKSSITINLAYTIIIWIIGMTIIGTIITIALVFLKSFVFGFSCTAFILTYRYKGIIISFIYLIFGQLVNIMAVTIIAAYSINFTIKLLKLIFKKNGSNHEILKYLKSYSVILLITIIINFISSLSETFILPAIIKLIIKLYI